MVIMHGCGSSLQGAHLKGWGRVVNEGTKFPPPPPPSSFLYPRSMTRSALHYLNAYNRLNNTNTVEAVLQGKSKSG